MTLNAFKNLPVTVPGREEFTIAFLVLSVANKYLTCSEQWNISSLLLLLLLSRFSRVWLCATPERAAHQAPLSLGFSRQEHWSGLPFPSPMHESEKGKWSRSVVSNSSRPHGLQPTRLLHPWDSPGKSTGVGYHCLLRVFLNSFIKIHKDVKFSSTLKCNWSFLFVLFSLFVSYPSTES